MEKQVTANKYIFIFSTLIILCGACKQSYPDNVEQALTEAGKNRRELDKVMRHYRKEPEKLRAAYFLIGNMPGKHGNYYPEDVFYFDLIQKVDSVVHSPCPGNADAYVSQYRKEKDKSYSEPLKRIPDLEYISSQYLIENIDLAFYVWKNKPWAKHLTFEEFCEWILPYRVNDEPLQNWRPHILKELEHLEDSLQNSSDPKEICLAINSTIAMNTKYAHKLGFLPMLGGVDAWKTKAGVCEHSYMLITLAMRSMGVPVSIDYTPKFARWPGKHAWMVLLDSDGKIKPFNRGFEKVKYFDPPNCPIWYDGIALITTVFRKTFAINNAHKTELGKPNQPTSILDIFSKEVSSDYDTSNRETIIIDINNNNVNNNAILFGFGQGTKLIPVSYSKIKNGKATFNHIQQGAIYVVGFYKAKKRIFIDGNAFIWDKNGIQYLIPDMNKIQAFTLYRKYPPQDPVSRFISSMKGARIQGSNYPDFRDANTLYTIPEIIDGNPVETRIPSNEKFRYYRYLGTETGDIRIAEIVLYYKDKNNQKMILSGNTFGNISEPDFCHDGNFEYAFDGNIATNFNAPANSWAAIDAGKPVALESFRVMVRSQLNFVEPGDTYELLYFDKGWKSLGKKQAQTYEIHYNNIPKGAVLLLKNLSKGKQERIFMIYDIYQAWW